MGNGNKKSEQKSQESNPKNSKPKLSEYELIRQRNIDERNKLFQELKFSQLKNAAAAGINPKKSSNPEQPKTVGPDDAFECQAKPSSSRKTKILQMMTVMNPRKKKI